MILFIQKTVKKFAGDKWVVFTKYEEDKNEQNV